MAKRASAKSKGVEGGLGPSGVPAEAGGAGSGGAGSGGLGGGEPGALLAELARPRPTSLDVVIGQERAVGALRAAQRAGRVHHAWVFHGPAGVGKFTSALAFAAELVTPAGLTAAGQGIDAAAVGAMLACGTHPDVHVVCKELASSSADAGVRKLKQTNIAVGVIDEFLLAPAARSRVVQSGTAIGKVFIVDQAELLEPKAQNQLLKTIEEPAEGTVIVLVTSQESDLLPTTRSRCQRVAFGPLSPGSMDRWLATSGLVLQDEQRQWLLSTAGGCPGQLTTALTHGLFGWHQAIEPLLAALDDGEVARAYALGSTMCKLVEERAAASVDGLALASKDTANRVWARRMLALVAERARRRLARAQVIAGGDESASRRLLHWVDLLAQADELLDANVQPQGVLDNLAAQMAGAVPLVPVLAR